jgi:hypothetical protein
VRKELFAHGIKPPMVHYEQSVESAVDRGKAEKSGTLPR